MHYTIFVCDDPDGKHVVVACPFSGIKGSEERRNNLKSRGFTNIKVLTTVDRVVIEK